MSTEVKIDIPLICGDPGKGIPASYTMFVLPFAYRPKDWTGQQAGDWCVLPDTPKDDPRRRYFTAETAHLLFDRAKRFDFRPASGTFSRPFQFFSKTDRAITVDMSRPELVLFEWPQDTREDDDPPRIAFLIVRLHLVAPPGKVIYLEDLLALNEKYRYFSEPFEGHRRAGYESSLKEDISDLGEDIYLGRWLRWLPGLKPEVDLVYSDSRVFVWTCAILEEGGTTLREAVGAKQDTHVSELGHWVKLLNIDSPNDNCGACSKYEQDWAKQRTYQRWAAGGTFYGFNYHGGAMLGPPWQDPPLWKHFMGMYFDQTLLLLYLRVALFSYSRRLSDISSKARRTPHDGKEQWRQDFQNLRWSFALFCNLYGFPLLSNQQQGIEMYTLAREHMDVPEFFEQVRQSIHSSHEFLLVEEEYKLTKTTTKLTVVASIGLALSLAAGILGMNVFDGNCFTGHGWLWLVLVPLISIGLILSLARYHALIARWFDDPEESS